MSNGDKISVLVINRNYGKYLKSCLDSALQQMVSPHEVILVDDGSTDESAEVAESYGEAIRFFRRPALGIYAAQKYGVEQVTGDWVVTLDSDDLLLPHCIGEVRSRISPHLSRISYRLRMISATGRSLGEEPSRKFKVPEGYVGDYWRKGWEVAAPPASGNVYPKAVVGSALGGRNLEYLAKGFYPHDRWLQTIASFEGECLFIPDVCGLYRIHGNSTEASSLEESTKILSRIEGHHSQASYLVAKYREMGHSASLDRILAYRYYYWWLRVLYWFASSGSEEPGKGGRFFLAGKLAGCVFRGAQTHFSVRCSRLAKAVLVALLPRSRRIYPWVTQLNRIARVRRQKAK